MGDHADDELRCEERESQFGEDEFEKITDAKGMNLNTERSRQRIIIEYLDEIKQASDKGLFTKSFHNIPDYVKGNLIYLGYKVHNTYFNGGTGADVSWEKVK